MPNFMTEQRSSKQEGSSTLLPPANEVARR